MLSETKRIIREHIREDMKKIQEHYKSYPIQTYIYFRKCRDVKTLCYKSQKISYISITIPEKFLIIDYNHKILPHLVHQSILFHENLKPETRLCATYVLDKIKTIFGVDVKFNHMRSEYVTLQDKNNNNHT